MGQETLESGVHGGRAVPPDRYEDAFGGSLWYNAQEFKPLRRERRSRQAAREGDGTA